MPEIDLKLKEIPTMRIPLIRSRNFTSHEIARQALDVPEDQYALTFYAMGCAQMVRDAASKHFGSRFRGLQINSSNRAGYNDKVDLAAENSHHIWRVNPQTRQLHCALDLQPLGVSTLEFFEWMKKTFRGEIGHEPKRGVVHYAPVGMEDEFWTDAR